MKPGILVAGLAIAMACPLNAQTAAPAPKLEMHGLVQVWAIGEDTSSTFRIRRAEVKLQGALTEKLRWQVQIDPTRATSILQDAMLSYVLRSNLIVDVGQYKVPLTREGTTSSALLETAERALFASAPNRFADLRDIGAQVRYTAPWNVDLRAGVFNSLGGNDNAADRDDRKSIMGQITVTPAFLRGIMLTSSGGVSVGSSDTAQSSNRFSAGGAYGGHGVTLRSEYLQGEEAGSERAGYYGLAAYRVHPRVELVTRYDVWDPDTDGVTGTVSLRETDYTGGLTYFIDSHLAKLQVNYMRKTFENTALSARNVVIFNAQAAW
jgi:phosphate-selective porin